MENPPMENPQEITMNQVPLNPKKSPFVDFYNLENLENFKIWMSFPSQKWTFPIAIEETRSGGPTQRVSRVSRAPWKPAGSPRKVTCFGDRKTKERWQRWNPKDHNHHDYNHHKDDNNDDDRDNKMFLIIHNPPYQHHKFIIMFLSMFVHKFATSWW